jgi:HK97 family phage major capsid protein
VKHFAPGTFALAHPRATPRAVTGLGVRADASDPKAMLQALQTAFEDFKAANDEKLKAKADIVIDEKVERINTTISDLQKAVDDANAKIAAAVMGAGTGAEIKDKEYTESFRAHFRSGAIQASLNKGADAEGGYLAPVEWDRTITDKLVQVSAMRQIASVQQISGAGFKKLFNARGMGSGWVGETAARPETTTPTLGSLTYTTGELYANPAATQQMLDDSAVNLEEWIANEVELEFSYQEGIAFVSGNGTNKPNGLLTYATGAANAAAHPWGAVPTTTVAGTTAITADELISLTYALPQEYTGEARFVMNRTTSAAVRLLKDGNGNYLWQPTFTAGQPATIAGYPVTEMPAMPNVAAGAIPVAFGDFRRGYLVIDRVGLRVLRDPYTNKPFVHFYTTKRVGGGLLNPEVLRFAKMAAS